MVKACDTPTMQLMIKDPIRPRAPSCWENLGIPMHKQNNPLKIVPANKKKAKLKTGSLCFKIKYVHYHFQEWWRWRRDKNRQDIMEELV
jgi:hypothetical protein